MPLTLQPIDSNTLYPAHCKFCLCFNDTDFIVDPGTSWFIQLVMVVNPLDGETFSLDGNQFTYRVAPALPFDILIGANPIATTINTLAAIVGLEALTPANYLVTQVGPIIVIAALKPGSEFDLVYGPETSPLGVLFLVAGVDPVILSPYNISIQLQVNISLDPAEICLIDNLFVVPLITTNKFTGELFVELCIDIHQFIKDLIKSPPPTLGATLPPFLTIQYPTLALMNFRFAVNGPSGLGLFVNSPDTYSFTNALCAIDEAPGLFDHSYHNFADINYLNVLDGNELKVCAGTEVFLYGHVSGNDPVPIQWSIVVSTLPSQSPGVPVISLEAINVDRDGILCINVTGIADASETILPHYEGPTTIVLSGDGFRTFQLVTVNYRSAKERECCNCRTVFYYLNKFGRWDVLEATCESFFKLNIQAQEFYKCEDCLTSEGGIKIYNKIFGEEFRVFTHRLPQSDYTRERLIDFFTSPEVYVAEGYMDVLTPVVVLGEESILTDSVNKLLQIPISYKIDQTKQSLTNI